MESRDSKVKFDSNSNFDVKYWSTIQYNDLLLFSIAVPFHHKNYYLLEYTNNNTIPIQVLLRFETLFAIDFRIIRNRL